MGITLEERITMPDFQCECVGLQINLLRGMLCSMFIGNVGEGKIDMDSMKLNTNSSRLIDSIANTFYTCCIQEQIQKRCG
jgi:hypothetical protein